MGRLLWILISMHNCSSGGGFCIKPPLAKLRGSLTFKICVKLDVMRKCEYPATIVTVVVKSYTINSYFARLNLSHSDSSLRL
jgi:hypothetical protein